MRSPVFDKALILTGPTGSGKSALALQIAPRLNAEIVALDSMTLYRGMDIGTAKPTAAERAVVRHHLLDVLDPWESASVAWWLQQAEACVADIESRGKRALFVGGTALYLKALLYGLFTGPPADDHLRCQLEQQAREQGNAFLHQRLQRVDPVSAARLHVNDLRRIIRALEVYELTGRPISQLQTQWRQDESGRDFKTADGWPRCLCLNLPREELYRRINARVEKMLAAGLVEEVQRLRRASRPLSREASQALGYKELFAYLDGQGTLEQACLAIQTRSRHFAKRQLTWFRQLPACRLIAPEEVALLWPV